MLRTSQRKLWQPWVGPRFADEMATASMWRMVRIPFAVLLFVAGNVFGLMPSSAGRVVWVICLLLVFVVLFSFGFISSRLTDKVSGRLAKTLRHSGHQLINSPDLRTTAAFAAWCRSEELPVEDVLAATR
jgi:hypothetical protein